MPFALRLARHVILPATSPFHFQGLIWVLVNKVVLPAIVLVKSAGHEVVFLCQQCLNHPLRNLFLVWKLIPLSHAG